MEADWAALGRSIGRPELTGDPRVDGLLTDRQYSRRFVTTTSSKPVTPIPPPPRHIMYILF
jgi:hypothetical protein